jgi:vitamin B12 transporter
VNPSRRRLVSSRFLVVALAGLLLPAAAGADHARVGSLEGSVRTDDGLALPHVAVTVDGPAGTVLVTTGPGGLYRVGRLAPGEYTATVDAPGLVLDGPAGATVGTEEVPTRLDLVLSPAPVRERVVVTAARGEALHSNLGVSTNVLDRERIEERAAPSLLRLLQEVPGTATARTGATGAVGSVFLRGGESRFAAVLVDGIPVNQPGGAFDWSSAMPFELERVEVVRGAASSLYGNDALAGVIQLVTRRAREDDAPSLRGEGEGGSHDWQRYQAATTGARGGFDWNAGAQRLTTDNAEPNSRFEQTALAASLGFRFDPRTRARAVIRYDDSGVGTPGPSAYGRPDLDASFERQDTLISASLSHSRRRDTHRLSFGHARTDQLSLNPIDSGCYVPEWEGQSGAFPVCDFPSPGGFQNQTSRRFAGYQADLSLGARHLLSAGADAEHETGELGNRTENLLRPRRTNFGVYVQDRVILGRRAYLTLGGRVERNGSYGTKAVPRAALAVRLREGENATTLRTSAGMGIKAPSFLEAYGESFFAKGNPDLAPERSRTADLGLEQRLFGGRLRAVVTAFHQDYRDQIAYTVVDFDTFEGTYVNLSRTRAQGLEVELDARPRPWLGLLGQYTFTDSTILDSPNDFSPIYAVGEPLLRRPRHQASLTARLRFPRWSAGATVVRVGERADSDFVGLGLTRNAAYTRFDARVHVRVTGALEAWVVGENLTDVTYQEVLGFPALGRSVRGGLRFVVGGGGQ